MFSKQLANSSVPYTTFQILKNTGALYSMADILRSVRGHIFQLHGCEESEA